MRRRIIVVLLFVIVIVLAILAINQFAPALTGIRDSGNALPETAALPCLTDAAGECLVMPAVTGVDIDNQEIAFPAAFTAEYYLVVMPYDRQQQQGALTWLEPFQEIAAQHETLSYFSIAALPDLSPPIRLLVVGGLTAGVRDEAVRSQVAVLFLEDQAVFLEALGVENADDMNAFLMDRGGTVYWRGRGVYSESAGEELGAVVNELFGS